VYPTKKKSNIYDYKDCDTASYYGYLAILKNNHHLNFTSDAMNLAAENGHLEVVKWLHENVCPVTNCEDNEIGQTTRVEYAMDWAASNGHLEVIKWLHYNRTKECTVFAMDWACYRGHLEVVKWLQYNRTEGCTTSAMSMAACNGQLEIVKWLRYNRTEGCTTDAMDWAASRGREKVDEPSTFSQPAALRTRSFRSSKMVTL
jgi:hypothetical protein